MEMENVGLATINKGLVDGKRFVGWDSVSDCTGNKCPLTLKCKYTKKGKCGVQVDYMRHFADTIVNYYKFLDEMSRFKIGMHLMPLYSYLCKLKIVEASLDRVDNITSKGIVQIHPIYKEIRETLKAIISMCRDLDIFMEGGLDRNIETEPSSTDGDPGYYQQMCKETPRKRIIR
jgi:hypothetical protein